MQDLIGLAQRYDVFVQSRPSVTRNAMTNPETRRPARLHL